MAKYHGRLTEVYIEDSGATIRDISLDCNSVETPKTADTAEVSGFTDTTKKYVAGLQDSQIRIGGNFNDAANKSHAVFSGLIGGTAGRRVDVYPRGSASGAPVFRGSITVSEYSVQSAIGGAVTWSVNLIPFDTNAPTWITA